ncbi:MAG: DMT family transporter [Syntrophaceae bacterium]|nr:DMT family transporter [Syntrophaceae bacterium]
MQKNTTLNIYVIICIAVFFWGLSFVATKIALVSIPVFTLIFIRFSIASIFFIALSLRRRLPPFTRKDHIKIFLIALFEPGLYFLCETFGLQYTAAPKAALIIATIPIMVLVISYLLIGERSSLIGIAGILLSLLGIGLLVAGDPEFKLGFAGPILGDLLIFGAVISASFYIVIVRHLGKKYSALKITTAQILYGTIFYAPAFLWELPRIKWSDITIQSAGALIFLSVCATVIAFLCFNHALTKIPAVRVSVFLNGIPVVTTLAAWILLGEILTMIQIEGGMLVLIGVFLANLPGLQALSKRVMNGQ